VTEFRLLALDQCENDDGWNCGWQMIQILLFWNFKKNYVSIKFWVL